MRKSGLLCWLRPDGKTQVTIQYLQQADGSVEPQEIHTVVFSTQHAGRPWRRCLLRQGPHKVDRPAAYICRQMAKSIVKSGLCKRALGLLS